MTTDDTFLLKTKTRAGMFPEDRFSPLAPDAERLHEDLWEAAQLESTPRTSRELGSRLVLHQFLPAWDVQAYVRVAQLPLHVHNSRYPAYEATGELPQLNDGNFLLPRDGILMHLQTFHEDIDASLTDEQRSESFAYRAMITEQLHRVLLFCRWVDPSTYREVTRPHMKKHIPFPLNQFLPKKIHLETMQALELYGIKSKEQAYVVARDCYTALNAKLEARGSRYFFSEDRPSALDVAAFGHVVDALGNPQLAPTLHQHAPRLVTLAEAIRDAYFSSPGDARPTSLDAATYSENGPNYFSALDSGTFMSKVPTELRVAFVEPYRSLDWGRRALASEVARQRRQQREQAEEKEDRGFDKAKRNVIIGAIAALVLYAVAALPVAIQFVDVDDLDAELDEDLEDDDDDLYDDE